MAEAIGLINVRSLNSELQKVAENELNEIPNRLKEDVDHIRKWLAKQPHIISRTDDQWILSFLRGCKFSLEKTKVKLENFYWIKPMLPEFFFNRDPLLPEIQEVLDQGIIMALPKVAHPTAPRIIMIRAERAHPDKIAALTLVKVLSMLLEILSLEDDNYTIAGHCIVVDLHNVSYKYTAQMTPQFIKKVIVGVRYEQPVRIKNEIMERIFFYNQNNMEHFYQTVPLSILPNEYGGTGGACDEISAQVKTRIEKHRQWFMEDSQYFIDETKRPKHSKTERNYDLGLDGSFRKLNID